jgi:hypothetical protein
MRAQHDQVSDSLRAQPCLHHLRHPGVSTLRRPVPVLTQRGEHFSLKPPRLMLRRAGVHANRPDRRHAAPTVRAKSTLSSGSTTTVIWPGPGAARPIAAAAAAVQLAVANGRSQLPVREV